MTAFEEKVNAYRENKRLIEELEAMNDAVKAEIIDMMHGAPEMVQGTAKAKKTPSYIVPGYIQYNGGLYSACNVFLSAADAWDWIYLFRGYCGEIYTAAEIGSIQEVNAK